jgi:hypothetical protein
MVTYGVVFEELINSVMDVNIINFRSCLQMTRFNWTCHYDINMYEVTSMITVSGHHLSE